MNEARIADPAVRKALRLTYLRRLRAVQLAQTARKVTPMPAKVRLSTRGEVKPSWYTKRWTPSRLKDLKELREAA